MVADRFHLVRLANDMLTEVRQQATREARAAAAARATPSGRARRGCSPATTKLDPEAFARLWNALIDTGDPGLEVLHAYTVKEELRALLALAGTNPTGADHPPARAVLRPGRRLPHPRPTGWPRPSKRGGRRRGRDHHRLLQRPIRGLQPPRQTRRTQRVRLPQRRHQRRIRGLHSSTPASSSQNRVARPSLKNRVRAARHACGAPHCRPQIRTSEGSRHPTGTHLDASYDDALPWPPSRITEIALATPTATPMAAAPAAAAGTPLRTASFPRIR